MKPRAGDGSKAIEVTGVAAASLALASVVLAACSGGAASADRGRVLATVRSATHALVAGQTARACSYLTAHGRRRALGWQVDFDQEGNLPHSSPRVPQTCERIAVAERRAALNPSVDYNWLDAARVARFRLTRITGSTAVVRVTGGPYATTVTLHKASAGWRIDDSPAAPVGH